MYLGLMKVVIIGTRGIPHVMGGIETHCEHLFPRVAAMGVDVDIVRRKGIIHDELKSWKGVKLIDIATSAIQKFEVVSHSIKAVNYAARTGADIVHVHAIGPGIVVPYAKLRGLKVVFTHHGPDYDREKWGRMARCVLKLGERFAVKYSDYIIVISDVIRTLVKNKYGRTQGVTLIYNGVPAPTLDEDRDYLKSMGLEKNRYILAVCRFMPEKRLYDLINAYISLREQGKIDGSYKLVIAGDGYENDKYSDFIKKSALSNGVILTGYVYGNILSSLYDGCALYVLPSSHEGLPIALLEAMSYGAPVVVSDIPANKEIGLPQECYFPCGDVEALASRISETLTSCQGKVHYDMTKYDWDTIAAQVLQVYDSVLNKRIAW